MFSCHLAILLLLYRDSLPVHTVCDHVCICKGYSPEVGFTSPPRSTPSANFLRGVSALKIANSELLTAGNPTV